MQSNELGRRTRTINCKAKPLFILRQLNIGEHRVLIQSRGPDQSRSSQPPFFSFQAGDEEFSPIGIPFVID
jgi:hypothetical protein